MWCVIFRCGFSDTVACEELSHQSKDKAAFFLAGVHAKRFFESFYMRTINSNENLTVRWVVKPIFKLLAL